MRPHPLNTPIGRFGIQTLDEGATTCVATLPIHDMVNPITGIPSLGPLAVLLDHVGGLVNHYRRADGEWTVSSELALEVGPDAAPVLAAAGTTPVVGTGRPLGARTATALTECRFYVGDVLIGSGTVRSFYIESPATFSEAPVDAGSMEPRSGLEATTSLGQGRIGSDGTVVLPQLSDRVLENSIGVIHGGIASTGLEVAASAAVNAGRPGDPLTTASLRVNFLRQFVAGDQSRYEAAVLRVGRRTGVADAQAVGADGRVAITARLTAYRC
jgi:uncharacterized protein (TIGR00369 family)